MGKSHSNADIIRKSKIFRSFGEGGYWHPIVIPSYPELISIGNNVTVCADVKFFEHDEINRMFNGDKRYKGPEIKYYTGKINVEDNVVIGANSLIMYNVRIGHNALVAAGSVVVKDVEAYSIVGGNPARVIGDTRELLKKRLEYSGEDTCGFEYNNYYETE